MANAVQRAREFVNDLVRQHKVCHGDARMGGRE
jgi:hypothetical protein